jgi:two-component system nitrogen regulation sensor histidine kinase NtrY
LTTSAKIRLMLALLFASLLFTAIIVQQTYTPKNSLYQTAQTLEDNLHKKEKFVSAAFQDKAAFAALKTLDIDDNAALKTIKSFTSDENIWLTTYVKRHLTFWSGVKVILGRPDTIVEGYSFVSGPNGRRLYRDRHDTREARIPVPEPLSSQYFLAQPAEG